MEVARRGSCEIESCDLPVIKKPKLLSPQDQDQHSSEEELHVKSNPIPICVQRREKYIKYEPELDEIKRKIADLRSKGFSGISFTAERISDAYKCLDIFSDPNGCKINYVFREDDSNDPEWDIAYLQLLRKYTDSVKKLQALKPFSDVYFLVMELQQDSVIPGADTDLSFQDYRDIYWYGEHVEQWCGIQEFLLDPKSREEYLSGPQTFEQQLQELKTRYRLVHVENLRPVLEAVVKWWTGGSEEKDRESAISLIDDEIKIAIEARDNRFEEWFLRADYVKLKVDVARAVGIIKEIPDELADFALPGNFKWSSSEGIFVRTPYVPYEQSERRTIKM